MKKYLLLSVILLHAIIAWADPVLIKNFTIKENPFGKDELAVVATDSLGGIQEAVQGTFKFTINGFDEDLNFENGTAFYRRKLEKSSFIYIKHTNEAGSSSWLYYVYRQENKLTPIRISWIILIAIPCMLILLGYLFRKFIVIAVILFCIFLYVNHQGGLNLPTFFETVSDGIKHLI